MAEGGPSGLRLYSLVALMTFLWALNFVIAKFALREFPPLLVAGLRTILAGATMIPVYIWARRRDDSNDWSWGDVPVLLTLGLLGVGLNQILFVLGLARTNVGHAAIMIGLTPVIVLCVAAAHGMERLNGVRIAGMLLALSGIATLQAGAFGKGREGTFSGDVLVLAAGTLFALFTVRAKLQSRRLGAVALNTFAYIGSAMALLPITLYESAHFQYGRVTVGAWASLLYMAIVSSVFCYLIYYYALRWIPASRISAFSYLQPLMATLLAIPLLGESPAKSLFLGGALVLTGVFLAERV